MKGFLTIFYLLLSVALHAQIYPVQVNTQLMPPYTPYLGDYTVPGAQKIIVQFRVNDPTISEYRCKLRVTIEGVGITLRTKQNFVPQPIVLEGGGIPQIFYGEDLAGYFDPNNLDFAGFSRNDYNKTGKLPEGVYRFLIEVLDYNRNIVVSNTATTVAWIILNDPPLLNLPRNETKVPFLDPTNIVFSWTPRHRSSPNAAFSTEYVFRLVEIWPAGRNPYDAFLTQPPLFETYTDQSHLLYGPAEPALIPGRKYAWQVQAVDANKRDLFKNQGRSEVYVFRFGDALGRPENLRQEAANSATLSVRWAPAMEGEMPEQFRLRYKPVNGSTWYETVTNQRWSTLAQLTENTEYDVQVRAEKGNRYGDYSTISRMRTAVAVMDDSFACGQPISIPPPGENTALLALAPGDVFTCADFSVVVTEVTNSGSGLFKGKGMVKVKMLNGASVEVTFSGTISNTYKLTTGSVISTYEAGSSIGQVIDEMHKIGEEIKPEAEVQSDSITAGEPIAHVAPGVIDTVYVDDQGKIQVIDEAGNTTTYEHSEGQETLITDSAGNAYSVGQDSQVTSPDKPTTAGSTANTPSMDIDILNKLIVEVLTEYQSEVNQKLETKE